MKRQLKIVSIGASIWLAFFLSVASAQNVGIGTASPASKLSVNGNLGVGSTFASTDVAPTDGAAIEGAVGIGTYTPRTQLEVHGIATVASGTFPAINNGLSIGWDTGGLQPGFGVAEFVNYSGTGGGNAYNFYRVPDTTGAPAAAPTASNLIASINTGGAYVQVSDARTKRGVKPLRYGLKEIMALSPQEYDFHPPKSMKDGKVKLTDSKIHQIGLLAQDVYKVVPEAVEKPENPATGLYTMSYTSLIPVLINAIQEIKHQQDSKATAQEARIRGLEAENARLQFQNASQQAELGSLKSEVSKLVSLENEVANLKQAMDTLPTHEDRSSLAAYHP